jgi:hypothetical protein
LDIPLIVWALVLRRYFHLPSQSRFETKNIPSWIRGPLGPVISTTLFLFLFLYFFPFILVSKFQQQKTKRLRIFAILSINLNMSVYSTTHGVRTSTSRRCHGDVDMIYMGLYPLQHFTCEVTARRILTLSLSKRWRWSDRYLYYLYL